MPTAIPAMESEQEDEQECAESTEISIPEDALQGPSRLLKNQRQGLEAEIEHAQNILRQPNITAEEGIYSRETLDRAVSFLKTHIEGLWQAYGSKAPMPTIGPGPAGSVDLYWEQKSWKLLINIPPAADALATFYADDYGRQKTRGSIDPNKFSIGVAAWLMA